MKAILAKGVALGGGQVIGQACAFGRNLIVARIIGPSDFGVAALFAVAISMIEMATNLAARMVLVQSKSGDEPQFQNTVHVIQALRGLFNGAVLFFLAGALSRLFGVPEARWAFQLLALAPVLEGLTHLDMVRYQRQMRFSSLVTVEVASNFATVLLAWPLATVLGDYSAMLWLVLLRALLGALLSHWVAERPFRLAWDREHLSSILHFGWPLIINGLLLFGILQGDRFIIGSANQVFGRDIFSLADLGRYSVVFGLALTPTMLTMKVATSLFLPILSERQADREGFLAVYGLCSAAVALAAAAVAAPLMIAGPYLVGLAYGSGYAAVGGFMVWIVAMQAIRTFRISPTLAAMAQGDTKNAMIANIFRSLALVLAVAAVATGRDLAWIAAAGFAGELLALGVSLRRLKRKLDVSGTVFLLPAGMAAALIAVWAWAGTASLRLPGPASALAVSMVLSALAVGIFVLLVMRRADMQKALSLMSRH